MGRKSDYLEGTTKVMDHVTGQEVDAHYARRLEATAWTQALEWRDLVPVGEGFLMDPISGRKWRRMNPAQERLAEYLVAGLERRDAVKRAGFQCTRESASSYVSTLLSDNQVFVNHVINLIAQIKEKNFVSLASHVSRLAELGHLAEKQGKIGQAITAEVHRGRAAGLYTNTDRTEEKEKKANDLEAIDQRIGQLLERMKEREVQAKHTFESDEDLPAPPKKER